MSAQWSLSLPGGGMTGALYQVGALAALEDGVVGLHGQSFKLYVGHSSGATVAAALAGGIPVERLYRALLDPVDNFFPLERNHLVRVDFDEYRRMFTTGYQALRRAVTRLRSGGDTVSNQPPQSLVLQQLDRFNDSLPAGLLSLDRYERFVSEFFLRRGIPNSFRSMPRTLRIAAYDIDSGSRVMFGAEGFEDVPVSLACAASMALPLFYSPVRVNDRHYIDGGLGRGAHLDVVEAAGISLSIVVSPMVPVQAAPGAVPTGHGARESVRDKGLLWTYNQAMRIGAHARLRQEIAAHASTMRVLTLEPEPSDAVLFLHNPASPEARRAILEYAYRTTRQRVTQWIERHRDVAEQMGWTAA